MGCPLLNSLLSQLLLAKHTETLVELLDTTASINNFLGTGVEWVTSTTHVQVQVFAYSGVDFDNVATSTGGSDLGVFRVDTWFHLGLPQSQGHVALPTRSWTPHAVNNKYVRAQNGTGSNQY